MDRAQHGDAVRGSAAGKFDRIRAPALDFARGIAVVAMVIYHLYWDFGHFGLISADVSFDPGWRLFAKSIAASFLVIVGVGLELATREGVRWRSFLKRLAKVSGAALLVTLGSWYAFPDSYIFFGILHCIALSSVIALAFLRFPAWALMLAGAAVYVLPLYFRTHALDAPVFDFLGLGMIIPASNDYEPIFPWFAWVLWGLALGKLRLPFLEPRPVAGPPSIVERLGQWSLPIYLIHQPVLFGALLGARQMGWI